MRGGNRRYEGTIRNTRVRKEKERRKGYKVYGIGEMGRENIGLERRGEGRKDREEVREGRRKE